MTNKTEVLATVLPDIMNYIQEHADEIPDYMHPAFLQAPSLEDDEVKDFQDGGPVSSTGVIKDEFGNFIPAPRMVGSERPVNPNAKKVFLKPDIPEGSNVESPFEGTPVSSIYAGIEYDDQGKPIVDMSYPIDREDQTALDSMLNVEAMSDEAFVDYFGKGLLGIGIKEQLGIPKVLSGIPPVNPAGILAAGFALVGDKLSKSLAEGALKGKYSPDEQIGILQDVVAKYSPVNRQDSEFFKGIPQPGLASTTTDQATGMKSSTPEVPEVVDTGWDAAMAAGEDALDIDVGPMAGIDVGSSGGSGSGSGSGGGTGGEPGPSGGGHGGLNRGGPVNMQLGGEAENADTNMEVANVPMGVVSDRDGAPGPFRGGTGVEDDLDMEVEAGSYVLNAESVQLVGISDINTVIRDAYTIAAKLGKPLPEDYDPQNKVPIRISNGEAVIPKSLVDIIGLDKLEKWNQKGLQLRKQKEKMMAEQQQAQPPQQQQVASEAPPVQPQSPIQAQMGGLMIKPVGEGSTILSDEELDETLEKPQWMTDHWETDKKAYDTEYAFGEHSPKLGDGTSNISNLTLEKLLEHQRQTVNNINRKKRLSKVKTPDMINGIPIPKPKPLNIIPSSAMGAYQILSKTVEGLVKNLKLDTSKVIFTPEIQDKLALSLLKGRGVDTYLSNPKKVNLTTVQNNLAKEWASLPTSDNKSAHNQSLSMKSDPFREQLYNIQQEVEQGNITLLHGKYKILAIIRKAETALR